MLEKARVKKTGLVNESAILQRVYCIFLFWTLFVFFLIHINNFQIFNTIIEKQYFVKAIILNLN